MMENFAISEPITGASSPFPCYIAFEHRGQIWVRSPLTESSTQSQSNLKLNDISMSSDGATILFAGRDMGCKFSTDYGATFSDVPTLSKGAACSISGTKMVVVDYGSTTKNVEYSANNGSSWTSSQISITDDFHEASIGSDKIVFSGENGSLYSSSDGYTWTAETSNLTDTLNGLVSYDSGFYFLNSPLSGVRSFHSLIFSGGGGNTSSPSSIIFNSAALVQKAYSTISESNTISFTLSRSLDSNAKFYSVVMLHDTTITDQPLFYGYFYCSNTEDVIIPITQQKITSSSYDNYTISFDLDGTFSGTYCLSYTRND